jgi:hypothetical protein
MGNCCGSRRSGPSRARVAAPAANRTWLETRLAEVLHAKERDGREIKHPFNKILLKFPLLRLVFQRVRQAFHSVDEASAPTRLCCRVVSRPCLQAPFCALPTCSHATFGVPFCDHQEMLRPPGDAASLQATLSRQPGSESCALDSGTVSHAPRTATALSVGSAPAFADMISVLATAFRTQSGRVVERSDSCC